ncbi:MAG: hypothetical protein ACFB2W_09695 [Leptolyngbyaceae cyanobacterium]
MSAFEVPQLPPSDDSEVSSLRYEVNPAIALNRLSELYQQIQQYQGRLRKLAHSIRQVYAEGPVVSGWLASEASLNAAVRQSATARPAALGTTPPSACDDAALFRHGDANDLMDYLSALESSMLQQAPSKSETAEPCRSNSPSQYYLCQLDSSGQIQAEPCPPAQVPVLSMAIARYRRLNQLNQQKQVIETKLQAVVDILGDAQRVLTD